MIASVSRPEMLNIAEAPGRAHFGGDQGWYADEWRRTAGCGPTCAANVTAYLAFTRPHMRALYAGQDMGREAFTAHMEAAYEYVTPGAMGINRADMLARGVEAFALSRGLPLRAHIFEAPGYARRDRPGLDALAEFVREGLEGDCPVAFLNLTRGRVKDIQGWHWITITSAKIENGRIEACASDEGREICFDLGLWYLSTRMRGGLVYFT